MAFSSQRHTNCWKSSSTNFQGHLKTAEINLLSSWRLFHARKSGNRLTIKVAGMKRRPIRALIDFLSVPNKVASSKNLNLALDGVLKRARDVRYACLPLNQREIALSAWQLHQNFLSRPSISSSKSYVQPVQAGRAFWSWGARAESLQRLWASSTWGRSSTRGPSCRSPSWSSRKPESGGAPRSVGWVYPTYKYNQ